MHPNDPRLRRAKIAVTAVFIAHAVGFSSWAAHIPAVKAGLGLSDAALGTALFGAPLGSVLATVASHWALPRWGSHRLIPVTAAGYALAGTTVGLARSGPALFAALALWGMFQGGLDVAMNTQAGTVERLARAPIMARFHGMWSLGALLGALIGAACVGAGVGLTPQLAAVGLVALIVVGALARGLIPDPAAAASRERSGRGWLTPTVAILAAVAFVSFLCEGAATDWSANYLRNVVGAGPGVAALSYAAYTLTMVLTRLGAIRLHSRLSARRLLPALALFGAAGLGVALAAANPVVAVAGFAALGVGVALLVPTAFSAAYGAGGAGSAIAIVAATGWLGYLLGPPLIGHLADRVGLAAALVTIPALMSVVAVAIRCVAAFDRADDFHRQVATPAG
ncbi:MULTISPECIES: MFS transporter [unclassified Mycobacterium]|uniref:MFS transporter n=1 Tax=unclassified Mycobacterium TaxID=2642494 RepID=UPI0007FE9F5A|nr:MULTISPECIES: MFS transporter [unclassified Mycobacterium]OBG52043.1 MFS transporter [Mycobacterium sp. E735]OBG56704.1 MFS transporter [Mycobacterium sp. E188]OBG75046.1 MFS transporter [Mycobacterium sp. E3298]OBH33977.1 MFS transporter [Mycobacterium sp. E183]